MTFYLNNWKGVDYAARYERADAFFDLSTSGPEADLAANLQPGTPCVVATRGTDGRVTFTWYSFVRDEQLTGVDGPRRVLCGPAVRTAAFSQADAARQSAYAPFFDKAGHFKRQPVVQG